MLAEETLTWGFSGIPPDIAPIPPDQATQLLDNLNPEENVSVHEKRRAVEETLSWQTALAPYLEAVAQARAHELEETNRRLREQISRLPVRVEPHLPPDLLGMLVVLPSSQGVTS